MSWFRYPCSKCRTKTTNEFEGKQLCPACEEKVILDRLATEKRLACPVCGKEMTKLFLRDERIAIDDCDSCGSVLLDGVELEQIRLYERAQGRASAELRNGAIANAPDQHNR